MCVLFAGSRQTSAEDLEEAGRNEVVHSAEVAWGPYCSTTPCRLLHLFQVPYEYRGIGMSNYDGPEPTTLFHGAWAVELSGAAAVRPVPPCSLLKNFTAVLRSSI
jgi:hypothetical protein